LPTAEASPGRDKNVVYLVMSHHKIDQLERLVRTIRRLSPGPIWLRHDYSKTHLPPERFGDIDDVTILPPSIPVTWGGFGIVQVLLDALAAIEAAGDYGWVVVLSGQDYPIRPLRDLEWYLYSLDADALLEQTPDAHDPRRYRRRRFDRGADLYRYRYYGVPSIRGRPIVARRVVQRLERLGAVQPLVSFRYVGRLARPLIGVRWPTGPFHGTRRPYQGSQWLVLSRHAVSAVLNYVHAHPSYVRHYRRTFIPDESFFHSILLNDARIRVLPGYLHFAHWAPHASSPSILTVDDLPTILESGSYLARKFDAEIDSSVLDHLDRILGVASSQTPPSTSA
jgi:hypothetical protein